MVLLLSQSELPGEVLSHFWEKTNKAFQTEADRKVYSVKLEDIFRLSK